MEAATEDSVHEGALAGHLITQPSSSNQSPLDQVEAFRETF